jgi:hypothetical protein
MIQSKNLLLACIISLMASFTGIKAIDTQTPNKIYELILYVGLGNFAIGQENLSKHCKYRLCSLFLKGCGRSFFAISIVGIGTSLTNFATPLDYHTLLIEKLKN